MRISTFDPNKHMVDPATIPHEQQATAVETVVREIAGSYAFEKEWSGVLIIKPARSGDFLVSFKHLRCQNIEHPMLETEEKHPDGNWAVMIVANMPEHRSTDSTTALQEYIRSSMLLGTFPMSVGKVAVVASQLGRDPWYGGLRILNEAGVLLVSDYAEALVFTRYDPVGAFHGFVRTTNFRYDSNPISEQTVTMTTPELLRKVAVGEAYQFVGLARAAALSDMDRYARVLSLGAIGWSDPLPYEDGRLIGSDIPCALRNVSGIPPEKCPERAIVETGMKIGKLHRVWNAYLQRYGIKLYTEKTVPDLEPFYSPQMASIISMICDNSDIDDDDIEHEAARVGDAFEDAMKAAGKPFIKRAWQNPEAGMSSRNAGGNAQFAATNKTLAVQQAIAHLNMYLADSGSPLTETRATFTVVDGPQNTCKTHVAEQAAARAKGSRWGVITVQNDQIRRTTAAAPCALMSGIVGFDDIDVIVALSCDFNAIDHDKAEKALSLLADNGIAHLCDVGGNFNDVPDLGRVVMKRERQSMGTVINVSLFVIPEKASPQALALVEHQAKCSIARSIRDELSQALRAFNPERAEAALSLLCARKIKLPREWEEETDDSENDLLKVLYPLPAFYPQYASDFSGLIDVVNAWDIVLEEHGFCRSSDFPIGVNPDLFEKTAKVIGISSYLEALDAGIPFEDLFPENNIRRRQ